MKKKVLFFIVVFTFFCSLSASAEQFYGGLGLSMTPGQPNYVSNGLLNFSLAYELESLWRFTFTHTDFKANNTSLKSMIIGAEMMYVHTMKKGLALVGGFGPSLYLTNVGGSSGYGIGMSATGSVRYALSASTFLEGAIQYKNGAVAVGSGVVDGGYTGIFINVGMFF